MQKLGEAQKSISRCWCKSSCRYCRAQLVVDTKVAGIENSYDGKASAEAAAKSVRRCTSSMIN